MTPYYKPMVEATNFYVGKGLIVSYGGSLPNIQDCVPRRAFLARKLPDDKFLTGNTVTILVCSKIVSRFV